MPHQLLLLLALNFPKISPPFEISEFRDKKIKSPKKLLPLASIFCRLPRRNLMTLAPPARLQDCQTAKYFHQHHDHRHYDHHQGHDHHDQNHHHGHDPNDEYDQCYI